MSWEGEEMGEKGEGKRKGGAWRRERKEGRGREEIHLPHGRLKTLAALEVPIPNFCRIFVFYTMVTMLISKFLLYRISNLKILYQSGYRFIPVFRHAV